jgi:hypothetical protein
VSLLLYKYALLAYSPYPEEDASIPLAAVCVPSQPDKGRGAIFVASGWGSAVRANHFSYIEETLRDWAERIDDTHQLTFLRLTDLSIGPIRTLKTGECEEGELEFVSNAFLHPRASGSDK